MNMNKYKVLKPVRINCESFLPDQIISLSDEEPGLRLLISTGAIQQINKEVSKSSEKTTKVDISENSDKKMEDAGKEEEVIVSNDNPKTSRTRKKETTSNK